MGLVITAATWCVITFVRGDSVGPTESFSWALVVICVLWALPVLVHAVVPLSAAATVGLGVFLPAATAAVLHDICPSRRSASALGLVSAPSSLTALVGLRRRRCRGRLGGAPRTC